MKAYSEADYLEAVDANQGFCTECQEVTRDMCEPDAEYYDCPEWAGCGLGHGERSAHGAHHHCLSLRRWKTANDDDGKAVVPEDFADFDLDDRKFLATHLLDKDGTSLVNATDTDWLDIEDELARHGAHVEHLIEDWLRSKLKP